LNSKKILAMAEGVLEDLKAREVKVVDVRKLTTVTDYMVIASGTSDRHVRSMADRLVEKATRAGERPFGVEGQDGGEWVLVDLQDVVVHIMQSRVRDFYKLENLWEMGGSRGESAG
jgi:ribosome-associated protein